MDSSLVMKVQYGETLRRFSSRLVDGKLDLDMIALRKKVSSLFGFPAGSDLDLTYVDEDGDVVKLADEEDLHDIMRQLLNPLRITVRLTTERSVSFRPSGNLTPVRSPQLQIPLQVGNTAVSQVLNSLPGTIRETVSGFESNSPAGYLVILDSLAKMGLTYLKEVSVAGAKSGPQESSTDAPVTKDKNSSISVGNTSVTKSGPPESSTDAPVTEDKNSSIYVGVTQVSELKIFDTDEGNAAAGNSEGFIMPPKDNANAKDKSSILLNKAAVNSCNDSKRHDDIASQGNIGKNGRSGTKMKLVKKSFASHPGWDSIMMVSKPLTRIDSPSSGLPVPPYMHRHQVPYRAAPIKRSHNHSDVMGSVFHTGIQCDGCGVHPISGPRFKSKVKEDYDLCIHCFNYKGIEAEYVRMDLPMNYQSPDPLNICYPCLGRSPTLPADHAKLDSCFILDVNFLDGTIMAPLTQFKKIWRMRNNGAIAWPHGTSLLWIGGEKLSKTNSCDLEMPAEGCPVGKEIDIAVDFTAPENPGRYISYWRMVSPSGLKFGQRVWVLIQVFSSLKVSDSKNHHNLNLNLPPVGSGIFGLQDVNASVDTNIGEDLFQNDTLTKDQNASIDPKIRDNFIKIDTPTMDQGFDLPKQVAIPGQQNSDADVTSSVIDVDQVADEIEQTLLKELENMGFTEVDLNKEILRKNEYDLEEALNELCDTEWDPMLAELQEMGFSNNEMNKMLLKKNNGSIKLVVMDLIAGEEDE